ncbi:MAG: hypothetical protein JNN33_10005 [Rhodospirillaceae bacterium]|jgi:hypothetical protein|nr:hypothetical protein [Rhodospirillaceae bacterium]
MLRLTSSVNNSCRRLRRVILRPFALAAMLSTLVLAPALAAALSPETAKSGTYVYQVTRNGEVVGEQRADFERRGGDLSVVTQVRINITLLGLTIYDFTQRIEEKWVNGQLMELRSLANDDGDNRDVRLQREGDRLVGTYEDKRRDLPGYLIPSTLWNSAATGHSAVLETVKGRERETRVTEAGLEQITLPIGTVQARHFVFSGEFSREVWYDEAGVLVASQMEAKDGSIIRQELLRMP